MLGLGAGAHILGRAADRWYARTGDDQVSLLRAYAYIELTIALMGLGIALILPHLGRVSAMLSWYSRDASGWYVLSTGSHAARTAIGVALLAPITLLMGGTLTLLIRHLVRKDLDTGGRRIALIYAVNTTGAAVGCFLTDFSLVPRFGLLGTQLIAVGLNLVAGAGAWYLASVRSPRLRVKTGSGVRSVRLQPDRRSTVRLKSVRKNRLEGRPHSLLTVVVQAFRPAVSGRPEGLHYFRRFFHRLFSRTVLVCLKADIGYE